MNEPVPNKGWTPEQRMRNATTGDPNAPAPTSEKPKSGWRKWLADKLGGNEPLAAEAADRPDLK